VPFSAGESGTIYCCIGAMYSKSSQQEWYYLQQQLDVPLLAEERDTIYCKSGAMLLEVPLTRRERGTFFSTSKAVSSR
jgi:hypothetical protein